MSVVLAEYLVTEDKILVFVVKADTERPLIAEIDLDADTVRTELGRGIRDGSWQESLAPLVEPILRWSSPDDVVWFVPADVLHNVPLHALRAGSGALADRNPVCYTPSASVMRYCHAKYRPADGLLVLADSDVDRPLSHARDQAFALAAHGNAHLFTGPDVTSARLESLPARLDVLHIACHGAFDQDDTKSGITLAGGGRLTAADILGMRIDANLVTLSACESGINRQRPGNELMGLTRSLIYAGASAVLVSLWAVDEISTNILMQRFYSAMRSGQGKAAALRAAMTEVRDTTLAQVIEYCERALTRLDPADQARILEDIADARFTAGDFTAALAAYESLARQETDRYPVLARAAARCRTAIRAAAPAGPGYEHRPFTSPYHWAPFVLIGDWR